MGKNTDLYLWIESRFTHIGERFVLEADIAYNTHSPHPTTNTPHPPSDAQRVLDRYPRVSEYGVLILDNRNKKLWDETVWSSSVVKSGGKKMYASNVFK